MQKSKSSSSVGLSMTKKIWRSRSKSQVRIEPKPTTESNLSPSLSTSSLETAVLRKPSWSPEGHCIWSSNDGRAIHLKEVNLYELGDCERRVLQKIALNRLNELNMGIKITIPSDDVGKAITAPKKRKALLLKKKARTAGIFDLTGKLSLSSSHKEGSVFGISLQKCVDNDNEIIIRNRSDSRASLSSLNEKENSSNESLAKSHLDDILDPEENVQRVPILVLECIKYLEEHGMNVVGIFRVSTSSRRIRELREIFDNGQVIRLENVPAITDSINPNDIATLLKEYLRDLPEPLLCACLFDVFVKTQTIRNRRMQLEAIASLIQLLPMAHRDTLYILLKFLSRVASNSDDIYKNGEKILNGNKMDSNNLATVFAPNMLIRTKQKHPTNIQQEIDESLDVINVIRTMIDHYEDLFRVSARLLDEIYMNMLDACPQQLDYVCEKVFSLHKKMFPAEDDSKSSPTPKRVYTRNQVLHEHAGKGGPPTPYHRPRESRMEYQDEKCSRRRRKLERSDMMLHDDRISMVTVFTKARSSSIDSNAVSMHHLDEAGINKKRSSTISSNGHGDDIGVVTGSLKIPMQNKADINPASFKDRVNQGDIQYIDDGHVDQYDNTMAPHKDHPHHIHTGVKNLVTATTAITGCLSIDIGKNDANVKPTTETKSNEPSIQKVQKQIIKPNSVPHKGDKEHKMETKWTPAAILRSKTANFERHFRAKTDEPKKVTATTNSEPIAMIPTIVNTTSKATLKSQSESAINNVIKQGPVYKRQEIISSNQQPTDRKK